MLPPVLASAVAARARLSSAAPHATVCHSVAAAAVTLVAPWQAVSLAVFHGHDVTRILSLLCDVVRHRAVPAPFGRSLCRRPHDRVPLDSAAELAMHVLRRHRRDPAHDVRLQRHAVGADRQDGVYERFTLPLATRCRHRYSLIANGTNSLRESLASTDEKCLERFFCSSLWQ